MPTEKYTKQGVRDLDSLGPKKSQGRKLELPPEATECAHKKRRIRPSGHEECLDCGTVFDEGEW